MSEWLNRCHFGDCLETLRRMPDGIVNTCVTSPPYFGLRSYGGGDAEIGKEETPEQFIENIVAVFREVRRVLRDDGTLWLNLGDSYSRDPAKGQHKPGDSGKQAYIYDTGGGRASSTSLNNLPQKNLLGIPWRVALALQRQFYAGKIKSEADRTWLAAIIDGEGCFFIHKRKAGTASYSKYTRADGTEANYSRTADTFGVGLEICNTSKPIIDRVMELCGGTVTTQGPEQNARRKQVIYRLRVAPNEAKRIAQEVYPHLVGKQHQARLIWNCPSTGDAGAAAHQAMMDLHNGIGTSVDYPAPSSLFEPGWILRQDVIWAKPNPLPESVTDRCTKSHEYIFLLSKSKTYYYDHEAIKEAVATATISRLSQDVENQQGSDRVPGKTNGPMKAVGRGGKNAFRGQGHFRDGDNGPANREGRDMLNVGASDNRNKRSVWTVSTKPYSGAHFATFPPELIEPCILAGAPAGGVVLDPFFGSGTTGQVSQNLGRQWIGCELNEAYAPLQNERLAQQGLILEAA
jgi:DNA modification methylase